MMRFQKWLMIVLIQTIKHKVKVMCRIQSQVNQRETTIKKRNAWIIQDKGSIFLFGDSIVKHAKGWKLSKNVDRKHKVYVRSFLLAKVKCLKDYIKPCIRKNNPDHVIIQLGPDELDSIRQAEMTAKSIIDVGKSIRTNTVSISQIVPRNDSFNNKALDVIDELSKMSERLH